jgi:hypothetical protein
MNMMWKFFVVFIGVYFGQIAICKEYRLLVEPKAGKVLAGLLLLRHVMFSCVSSSVSFCSINLSVVTDHTQKPAKAGDVRRSIHGGWVVGGMVPRQWFEGDFLLGGGFETYYEWGWAKCPHPLWRPQVKLTRHQSDYRSLAGGILTCLPFATHSFRANVYHRSNNQIPLIPNYSF